MLILNVAVLMASVLAGTFVHELGHALAGRCVGFRIFTVNIGMGRVVAEFVLWNVRLRFLSILLGGSVLGVPQDLRHYRLRRSIFTLGGPLANVILIVLGIELLWIDGLFESGLLSGFIPVTMMLLSNAVLLFYSLFLFDAKKQEPQNDILLLWQTWRQPRTRFQEIPVYYYVYEAEALVRQKRFDAARECIKLVLQSFPDSYYLEFAAANHLLSEKKYADARRACVRLLELVPEIRTTS